MIKKKQDVKDERIKERKRKAEENKNEHILQQATKRSCSYIDQKHAYLSLPYGMVYFSPEYIQHLKETYKQRSYLGKPDYKCKYCNAIFWYDERNKYDTKRGNEEILYSNCCKYGKIRIPKFREHVCFHSNITACLLSHRWEAILIEQSTKEKALMFLE